MNESGMQYDVLIIGAGTAGLAAALRAHKRGLKTALVDVADDIGGTLHLANGQVSGGGTDLQRKFGISDSAQQHFEEIMHLTQGGADPYIVDIVTRRLPQILNDLLRDGLNPLDDHPVTGALPGQAGYETRRYFWDKEAGRAILRILRQRLAQYPEIDVHLGLRAIGIEVSAKRDDQKRVTSLITKCTRDGHQVDFTARNFVLATGGYAMNPRLFELYNGGPAYLASSWPHNQGDGLDILTSHAALLRGAQFHRPGSGSILSKQSFPAEYVGRFITNAAIRQPWEIYVNNQGKRFVREDTPEVIELARALAHQTDFRYAIIYDAGIREQAPSGLPDIPENKLNGLWNCHPMFHVADSLEELAARVGLDANHLMHTVVDYNRAVEQGDDCFGRRYLPRKIDTPPYYAVIHLGHSATSAVGVAVDEAFRPLTHNDDIIAHNLFAIGELLGSSVTLGDVFTPGMMIGPALAEGEILADYIADLKSS